MTDFFNPPQEIIDAANKLTLWASENNLTNWCINGVAGRWPILPRKGEVYLSEPEMRKVFLEAANQRGDFCWVNGMRAVIAADVASVEEGDASEGGAA